ncbi:hypothetical protein CCACVL1_17586 [Corchorus capsularis]|uniref:Uncharacterized protein n=1 Tax=Corchorus capsularis TaxID=210143 RepID=A0A1R3HR25_COCAP|nr:hypothetical protein CCACVL1_17586 [Corchorus capsularis]
MPAQTPYARKVASVGNHASAEKTHFASKLASADEINLCWENVFCWQLCLN